MEIITEPELEMFERYHKLQSIAFPEMTEQEHCEEQKLAQEVASSNILPPKYNAFCSKKRKSCDNEFEEAFRRCAKICYESEKSFEDLGALILQKYPLAVNYSDAKKLLEKLIVTVIPTKDQELFRQNDSENRRRIVDRIGRVFHRIGFYIYGEDEYIAGYKKSYGRPPPKSSMKKLLQDKISGEKRFIIDTINNFRSSKTVNVEDVGAKVSVCSTPSIVIESNVADEFTELSFGQSEVDVDDKNFEIAASESCKNMWIGPQLSEKILKKLGDEDELKPSTIHVYQNNKMYTEIDGVVYELVPSNKFIV